MHHSSKQKCSLRLCRISFMHIMPEVGRQGSEEEGIGWKRKPCAATGRFGLRSYSKGH